MRMYDVLVFPGGTEIGLEIQRALCQCKDIRLYSAGLDVSNHAPYVFARHFSVKLNSAKTLLLAVLPHPVNVNGQEKYYFPHIVVAYPRLNKEQG